MPIIGAKQRGKQSVPFVSNLATENNETLYAYARFIDKPLEFVLNRLISTVLAMDPEYCQWRDQHRESFTPQRNERRTTARKANAGRSRDRGAAGESERDV